ncbi:MAG: molybdopterin-synthase adenylyltransferase MoeB [Selenomonadaceae bacterium]|nr:molybdopterin-synthase adenylyltransferase MoeB [Selenomonadaceae bacterium]
MAVTVLIPTTLRSFTTNKSELILNGSTVEEILNELISEYEDVRKAIFDNDKKLRSFVNVFVDGQNIKELDGFQTKVRDGAEIMLIPAIAGGAVTDSIIDNEGDKEKLSNDEINRYSRHLLLKEIGLKGQRKLKAAKALIVGVGGLGTPLAQYLAAAGVGTIGLVDFDEVEASNLQRQVIHRTRDVGRPKVMSAKDAIKNINPLVKVETYNLQLNSQNALDLISKYDVVADATDNYKSRYLINDACVLLGKPDVFGAMYQFEGQSSVYYAKEGACYRCVYPSPPPPGLVPTCAQGGVVGVLPGIIGTIQANEIIKLIVGGGAPLINRLLVFDAWKMKFRELKISKNEDCPICGKHPTITSLEDYDYDEFCGLKVDEEEEPIESMPAQELKRRLDSDEPVTIIDIREPHERAIVKFPATKIIPIGQLARRQDELDPKIDTVFICKEGKRSILAIRTLREAGYKGNMYNLKDGINDWAKNVDRSLPQY